MGVIVRRDSPYFWLILERPGQRPLYESSKIPVHAPTPAECREQRALAQRAYNARMGDLARARYQLPVAKPARSFAEHADWYRDTISATKRNTDREASMLRQLVRHFGTLPLDELDRERVLEWRTARLEEVAAGTVNREHEILRHMLGLAVPKYLARNPAGRDEHGRGLGTLRVEERDVRILTLEEEDRLLVGLTPEWAAIVLTALDTLMRLTSVVTLTGARDQGSHLVVLNSKTSFYKVPISTRLRAALDALGPRGRQTPLFPSFHPDPAPVPPARLPAWRRKQVARGFAAACARADVPYGRAVEGVTFHCLRHTGASRMLAAGVSIKTVMQIGNWRNMKVLQRYLHPTEAERRAAVERIGARTVEALNEAQG